MQIKFRCVCHNGGKCLVSLWLLCLHLHMSNATRSLEQEYNISLLQNVPCRFWKAWIPLESGLACILEALVSAGFITWYSNLI